MSISMQTQYTIPKMTSINISQLLLEQNVQELSELYELREWFLKTQIQRISIKHEHECKFIIQCIKLKKCKIDKKVEQEKLQTEHQMEQKQKRTKILNKKRDLLHQIKTYEDRLEYYCHKLIDATNKCMQLTQKIQYLNRQWLRLKLSTKKKNHKMQILRQYHAEVDYIKELLSKKLKCEIELNKLRKYCNQMDSDLDATFICNNTYCDEKKRKNEHEKLRQQQRELLKDQLDEKRYQYRKNQKQEFQMQMQILIQKRYESQNYQPKRSEINEEKLIFIEDTLTQDKMRCESLIKTKQSEYQICESEMKDKLEIDWKESELFNQQINELKIIQRLVGEEWSENSIRLLNEKKEKIIKNHKIDEINWKKQKWDDKYMLDLQSLEVLIQILKQDEKEWVIYATKLRNIQQSLHIYFV